MALLCGPAGPLPLPFLPSMYNIVPKLPRATTAKTAISAIQPPPSPSPPSASVAGASVVVGAAVVVGITVVVVAPVVVGASVVVVCVAVVTEAVAVVETPAVVVVRSGAKMLGSVNKPGSIVNIGPTGTAVPMSIDIDGGGNMPMLTPGLSARIRTAKARVQSRIVTILRPYSVFKIVPFPLSYLV